MIAVAVKVGHFAVAVREAKGSEIFEMLVRVEVV
jgi:hypothetical protein